MPIDLLTTARALIAIDSRSSLSDGAIVDYLIPLCRQAGLHVSVLSETRDGVRQHDLIAGRGRVAAPAGAGGEAPAGSPEPAALVLATHLDTVPPGDEGLWTMTAGRPFELTERDGMLHGLGTADVKLDFLCKLLALERLKETELRRPVALAGTYGEETGRWGAALLADSFADRLGGPPQAVLVGEPTGLRPCTAHKGYVEIHCRGESTPVPVDRGPCWSVRFSGAAAHSSQPHKGVSANDACLGALALQWETCPLPVLGLRGGDLVNKVPAAAEMVVRCDKPPRMGDAQITPVECPPSPSWSPDVVQLLLHVHRLTAALRERLSAYPAAGFDPPCSSVNNGLVYLSPGAFSHVVDVRRVPGQGPCTELEAHFDALYRLAQGCDGPRLAVDRVLDSAPFAATGASRLLQHVEAVLTERGLPTHPELKSGTTEAPVYAQAGSDVLVFGPGVAGGNIHKPNEHVPLADLRAAIDIYEALIRRICG